MTETVIRKIIHVDMDAFYASVEQRDNPYMTAQKIWLERYIDERMREHEERVFRVN